MNLEETTFWASGLLPDGLRTDTRQVQQSFPEFTVAEVFIGAGAPGAAADVWGDPAETVAMTLDAARIEPGLVTGDGADLRVEFITVTAGHSRIAGDLVVAAATMISQDPHQFSPQPGLLLPELGRHVDATMTAVHGLLVPPFLWEDGVPRVHEVDFGGRHGGGQAHEWTHPGRMTVVAQLVMLTDAEFRTGTREGFDVVQQQLLAAGTDLNDVRR